MSEPAPGLVSAPLSADEMRRYARHFVLPQVGEEGQRTLKRSRVLLVGAGGLGSPVALYLAAAGVGALGLVDDDVVDASNLQRQILHGTRDVGRSKLESARERILDVNPHVEVELHATRLTSDNALEIVQQYDVLVDGTDNFPTRYLTNDACVLLGRPNVYGSIFRFEGQASVFATRDGPCYRCLYPEPPPAHLVPSCAEGGVLGVLPGIVGSIQATEAIKLLLGIGETLAGRLLVLDALRGRFQTIAIAKDPGCPACGTREIRELIDYDAFCGGATREVTEMTPRELARRLANEESLELIDVREPYEWNIAHLEGARLIPLAQLPSAVPSLDRSREIVVYCHHGIRSAHAAEILRGAAFPNVWNLAGGIARWSSEVDPSVPQY
jgi:sulfur-carrier protein adenylyltransferase/sulfurtransferase